MDRASHETGHTNSTLADLPAIAWVVDSTTPTHLIKAEFNRRPDLPGAIVLHDGKLLAIVARDTFFRRLSGPYCRELFLRKSIQNFITNWPIHLLQLPSSCSIHAAAELALARPDEYSYDPILVDYGNGDLRLLDTHALLIAQSQLLALSSVIVEQRDAAEAANRSKSEFLANISHELRTPLHGILSYSRFGLDEAETGDRGELREFFDNVGRSAEILLELVNDLLDLSKLEAGRMTFNLQPTCMSTLVEVVVDESCSLIARKDIRIRYRKPEESMIVLADEERFKQVIRNLLSNAVKFSPNGGMIHVSARCMSETLLISVRDEGPGIPPNEMELVFDKFMQSSKTKSGSGGTGLGLAICREIVAGHHGRIWAENNVHQGCIFYCELPMASIEEYDGLDTDAGSNYVATMALAECGEDQ
ncbi:MAG: ATP-binding protein [Planctomycetota bacterium]